MLLNNYDLNYSLLYIVNGEKLDKMGREFVNSLHPRKPAGFPADVVIISSTTLDDPDALYYAIPSALLRPREVSLRARLA